MKGRVSWARWSAAIVALLAVAASAVSIVNSYTYDDRYVIELNPFARNMSHWWRVFSTSYWPKQWGGDGYRPLTILAFKIQSTLGAGKPMIFHAANILFYAATCVLVLWLARRMLPTWAAFVVAALFAVHPVHVEAVANIVGQSELLVALAIIPATILYLRDRQRGELRGRTIAAILALYAFGCFSKEHGVVLPAILIAAELTVIADPTPLREKVRRLRPFYLALALIGIAFIGVRSMALSGEIDGFAPFTPFSSLRISNVDRILTALGVVPQWIRLFYWPAHLSAEYGPPDIEIAQGLSFTQLPGLMLLVAILAFGVLLRRRKPVVSFGIAFTCITLLPASNFILPAGIVLAERTLFLPSVGALLIVGSLAVMIADSVRTRPDARTIRLAALGAFAGVLAVALVRSERRSRVWHDNFTLMHRTVKDSPYEYRAHYMLGVLDFNAKREREGEAELRTALKLFPYDPSVSYTLAEQYRLWGLCDAAAPLYRWTRGLDPDFPMGRTQFAMCLLEQGKYADAKAMVQQAYLAGGDFGILRRLTFIADSSAAAKRRAKASTIAIAGAGKLPESMQKTGAHSPAHPLN